MRQFISQELKEIKEKNLYRTLKTFDCRVLLFSSNDYLGLSRHPGVIEAAVKATEKYGAGAGASRLVSGNIPLYEELEEILADFKGTEKAIVFSSGYLANLGAITSLAGRGDLIAADRLNHASLQDSAVLSRAELKRYRHGDIKDLKRCLENSSAKKKLIITDGVFSMDGDIAPLPQILELAEIYDAIVFLDDAHSTGVLGEKGKGTCSRFNIHSERIIQMGTLSKALGSLGGFIAGNSELIEFLINRSRSLIYTTALPPSALAASIASLKILMKDSSLLERLRQNSFFVREELKASGFDLLLTQTPIMPLMMYDEAKALRFSKKLLEEGIYIPAIRPPTVPKGESRLRLTVSAGHSREEIERGLGTIKKIGREMEIIAQV